MKKILLLIILCFSAFIGKSQITLAVASAPASCSGSCDGQAIVIPSGGTPGYTYSWSTAPPQLTASATGLCSGSYTVTVTDAMGATATASVFITEPTPVVLAPISSVTICIGESTTLTANASGGTGGYTYTWDGTFVGQNYTVSPTGTTVYTVFATDANGCSAAPVNVTVTVSPPLSAFPSGDVTICTGNSTNISAVAAGGNGGPYTYTWDGTFVGQNYTVSPTITTTYTVTVNDGCSPVVATTVTVTVDPCSGIQSFTTENSIVNVFPNPFTLQTTIDLNADYKNATLKIIDVLGKEIWNKNFSGKQFILERTKLKNGIYFIQIVSEDKTISTNKIIIN